MDHLHALFSDAAPRGLFLRAGYNDAARKRGATGSACCRPSAFGSLPPANPRGKFWLAIRTAKSGTLALRLPPDCDRAADLSDLDNESSAAEVVYTHRSL